MVRHTDTSVVTIDRYIIEQERKFPEATGDLSGILYDLALASKMIANKVRLAGLVDVLGAQGSWIAENNVVSQAVPHVHVHVVPRTKGDGLRGFFWPRTKYESDAEAATYAARLRSGLS